MVDEFILLDDVQYTKRDWRNRNLLKTPAGLKWLTIPVNSKGNYNTPINKITVTDNDWSSDHWKQIASYYSKAPFFDLYFTRFDKLYTNCQENYLSKINFSFIQEINNILGIETKITWSTDYFSEGSKTIKLVSLCKSCGADSYLSGPAAKDYLDELLFQKESIEVEWMDYSNYSEYSQLHPPFSHGVTILDLLFNEGPDSIKYMKSFNKP
jgi:uncharacterized protein YozE (UPF0346 family)